CVFCNECMETSKHLMFECKFAQYVWKSCYLWLGEVRVLLPSNCFDHFWQHGGGLNRNKSILAWWSVWAAMVWGIWTQRHDIKFNMKNIDSEGVLDAAKYKAWSWCKAYFRNFDASLYVWNLQPLDCL
ncbi:hypothetical protein glysoja_000856, partial [Glycine soja]